MIGKLLSALCAICIAAGASAATVSGVSLPDTYPVDGQTLVLNGAALRTKTILGVKVYVAGLYLAQPSHNAAEILAARSPKVIVMSFLHSASKQDVEDEYHEGEQTNCSDGSCNRADEPDFERLVSLAPAVKPGDSFTYIITARGLKMLFDNRVIADIPNPSLARQILSGFIGPHPPAPTVRDGLLGVARP